MKSDDFFTHLTVIVVSCIISAMTAIGCYRLFVRESFRPPFGYNSVVRIDSVHGQQREYHSDYYAALPSGIRVVEWRHINPPKETWERLSRDIGFKDGNAQTEKSIQHLGETLKDAGIGYKHLVRLLACTNESVAGAVLQALQTAEWTPVDLEIEAEYIATNSIYDQKSRSIAKEILEDMSRRQ